MRGKALRGRVVMKTGDASKDAPGATSEVTRTWQERAVERRLGEARALAVARSTQFMATALELVQESGQANFTLQTLAERANMSVRTFYQHFSSKDELLLALYEDVTARYTEAIREQVEAADGPVGRLEAWCRGVLSRPGSSQEVGGRLVLMYNLSLEVERPEAFAKVWAPHRKLLTEILTACSDAGLIRNDLSLPQLISLLGYTMTSFGQFNALHEGMDGTNLTEDVVWSWCWQAIAAPATVKNSTTSN
ncbi:TetR family transcriptional regulator [Mycobacterium sp. GA-1841]|nr:TetR family transcriptional regulator [Mycobacterium sp. GA-1841]